MSAGTARLRTPSCPGTGAEAPRKALGGLISPGRGLPCAGATARGRGLPRTLPTPKRSGFWKKPADPGTPLCRGSRAEARMQYTVALDRGTYSGKAACNTGGVTAGAARRQRPRSRPRAAGVLRTRRSGRGPRKRGSQSPDADPMFLPGSRLSVASLGRHLDVSCRSPGHLYLSFKRTHPPRTVGQVGKGS